ncbi:NACHT domain-containing protein [Streptomyces althioticus]|uniref:NACHT domain-containing protein n=1 Tax=Streptomyces althioticus TaxID=83380 RepID=UPI0033D48E44
MASGEGSRAGGGDGLHQEISGGTQQNVVFAQVVENVSLHGDSDLYAAHGAGGPGPDRNLGVTVLSCAIGLLGVFLLLVRPGLSLPAGLDPGPVVGGGLLLAGAVGVSAWSRLRRRQEHLHLDGWRTGRILDRAAEALAESLVVRYDEDERLRRLNDPYPLDVPWTALTPPAEESAGADEEHPPDIADYYTATPAGRLVVLGGAGAGKSVLVLRLAHSLLHRRTRGSGDPVPVIVSLASWDPNLGLLLWMAEQLVDAHPQACGVVPEVPPVEVAFHLLLTGRVLPLLDGFDELPQHRRATALHQIGETMRGRRPFVLASREAEYRRHAPDQLDFERTEIRLGPLGDAAVRAYLSPGQAHTRWTPVLNRMADHSPAAPLEVRRLRQVLSVPLMVGLARVAYARGDTDPSELLERGAFRSRADIESHLYDAFLDAVYSSSYDIQAVHGGWSPRQARTWIGFLAARMKAANEQDFAWWRLDRTVPRSVSVLVMVPALLAGWLPMAVIGFGLPWWQEWLPLSLAGAFAMLCGLALVAEMILRTTGRQEAPRMLHRPGRTEIRDAFPSWPERALAVGAVAVIAATMTGLVRQEAWLRFVVPFAGLAVFTYGPRAVRHMWRKSDAAVADSPAAQLRSDRRSVLALGWCAPASPGSGTTPLRAVLFLPPALLLLWQFLGDGRTVVAGRDWVLMAVATPVFWGLFSCGASAWGGFTMSRLHFWVTGRLPWRLLPFLEDAHARGVLRQAGGVYRFRHIELRNRLARVVPAEELVQPHDAPGRLRRSVAGVILVVVAAGQSVLASGAVIGVPWPVSSLPAACALLDPADKALLMREPARIVADDGASCATEGQAPSGRDVTIDVSRILFDRDDVGGAGGTERAHVRYGQLRVLAPSSGVGVSDPGFHRDLSGLGHEAFLAVWQEGLGPSGSAEASRTARVVVRVANAVIELDYSEQSASADRVADIAQILVRTALRRADLSELSPREGDPEPLTRGITAPAVDRPLTSVPPSAVRSEDSPFPGHYTARSADDARYRTATHWWWTWRCGTDPVPLRRVVVRT